MAKGPKGERRPDDPAQAAVAAVRIALGEIEGAVDETATVLQSVATKEKNAAAVALGRLGGKKGGKARADKLTVEQKRSIARRAALARWKGHAG